MFKKKPDESESLRPDDVTPPRIEAPPPRTETPPDSIGDGPPTVTDPEAGTAYVLVDSVQRKRVAPSVIVELYPKLFRVCEVAGNTVSLVKDPAEGDKKAVPYTYHELRLELALKQNADFPPLKLVTPLPIPDEPA